MIVSCPQCAASYRLDISVVMRRPKLKCADCGLRWVPAEDIDEDEAIAAVQEEVRAARNPPPPPPAPEPVAEPEPAPPPPEPEGIAWGKWLVAIVVGTAFATASVGLWVGRIEPDALPGVNEALARLSPPSQRLDVDVVAQVTRLPAGGTILEITGGITNPGRVPTAVPPLNARLLAGGEPVRDWTIPPPANRIAPGQRLGFASTITDVPARTDAAPITVQVRLQR